MRFQFEMAKVRPLVEHAKRARPAPILNDLFDANLLKPGCAFGTHGYAATDDLDVTKIPPCLVMVNDAGVYLMCSTEPELLNEEGKTAVVYAEGYTPAEGGADGDDFAETLELDAIGRMTEAFTKARSRPDDPAELVEPTWLFVDVLETQLTFSVA